MNPHVAKHAKYVSLAYVAMIQKKQFGVTILARREVKVLV